MIGVILWSDPTDQKAVIWCEDQGDLAFLSSPDEIHLPEAFFDVGDVVEFDVQANRNMRLARNAIRLRQGTGTELRDELQAISMSDGVVTSRGTAEIIPFRIAHATRALPDRETPHQLRG